MSIYYVIIFLSAVHGAQSLTKCLTGFSVQGQAQQQQQQQFGAAQQQQFGGPQQQQQQQQQQFEFLDTETNGPATEFTISMWIYHQTAACQQDFLRINILSPAEDEIPAGLGQAPPDSQAFIVRYGEQGLAIGLEENFGQSSGQVFLPFEEQLADGWHHLAITWSSLVECGQLTAYIDGRVVGTGQLPLQLSEEIGIGELSVVVNPYVCTFQVQFSDVNLFSRVLAPREIARVAACQANTSGDLVSYSLNEFKLFGGRMRKSRPRGLPCCEEL